MFRRFPRYWLAVLAITVVPALYALIYLTSVWNPNAQTPALPVAVVNLDAGIEYRGHRINVGAELTKGLIATGTFGFRTMADAQVARQAVRRGELAFAVVIPGDFSANAVPGVEPGAGKVTVILSEGNNYASAGFARRFAEDLGHQVNEMLNEQRWAQVLASADGSGKSLNDLRAGMVQLQAGLQSLEAELARNNAAVAQVAAAVQVAGSGLQALGASLPADAELKALRNGIGRLAARQRELSQGLEQLHGGADRMAEAAASMQEQTSAQTPLAAPLAAGSIELAAGRAQLRDTLNAAQDSSQRLGQGMLRADASVGKLVDSVANLAQNLQATSVRLPASAALATLSANGKLLTESATQLRFGVEMAASMLPATPGKLDGSARGLADSVEPALEVLAPVANNGSAFAPNMAAMALWLGAVMIVYVFAMQALPGSLADTGPLARVLGKFALPAATALAQAVLILLMLVWGLGVSVPHPLSFASTLFVTALAFLAMVYLLLRLFGEAGKLLAVLLLTLQLAAGGGVLPIELSGDLFRALHGWLPFTWVVRALRASLFGAYDNGWFQYWSVVAGVGVAALLLSAYAGRWKLVDEATMRPPIEV